MSTSKQSNTINDPIDDDTIDLFYDDDVEPQDIYGPIDINEIMDIDLGNYLQAYRRRLVHYTPV